MSSKDSPLTLTQKHQILDSTEKSQYIDAKIKSQLLSLTEAHQIVKSDVDAIYLKVSTLVDYAGKYPHYIDTYSVDELIHIAFSKVLSDTITGSDQMLMSFHKTLNDSVTPQESSFSMHGGAHSSLIGDPLSTSDEHYVVFNKILADINTPVDSISLSFNKTYNDTVMSSDGGKLRMTNYTDISYFAEDYVGISLTF